MARRVVQDQFFRQAKAEGYVARSAYKLKEIAQRKRIFKSGDRVLDLGCAPGAWLQVAAEIVGPRGRIVGLDLQETRRDFGANVTAIVGDIYKVSADELRRLASDGGGAAMFDAVLSDMAPSTSGAGGGSGDHFLSVRLCERVLEMLPGLLKPTGALAMKVFEGEQYPALLRRAGREFTEAKGFKPKASRDVSREMYIVGTGYLGVQGVGD